MSTLLIPVTFFQSLCLEGNVHEAVSCYFVGGEYEELTPVKDAHRNAIQAADFGPQRFTFNGEALEMSNEEGVYLDKDGRAYTEEETFGSPRGSFFDEEDGLPNKVRAELTPEETKWMENNEPLLEKLNDEHDEWECNSYFEDFNADGEQTEEAPEEFCLSLADVEFSKERTHMSKAEVKFWVKYKSQLRMNLKNARELVAKADDFLDKSCYGSEFIKQENKHYRISTVREYLLAIADGDDTPKRKFAKWVVVQALDTIKHFPFTKDNIIYVSNGTFEKKVINYNVEFAFWQPNMIKRTNAPLMLEYKSVRKVIHIDFYKSLPSAKEGFANVWTTVDGERTGSRQLKFITNDQGEHLVKAVVTQGKEAGYVEVNRRDMYELTISKTGWSPLYTKARTLWNNRSEYISVSKDVSALV